jgi:dienelactone hydrolase
MLHTSAYTCISIPNQSEANKSFMEQLPKQALLMFTPHHLRTLRAAVFAPLAAWLAATTFNVHSQTVPSNPAPERATISVPGLGLFGGDAKMVTQVFKPSGDGPFPVVLYSHGRGDTLARSKLANPVNNVVVSYWLAKGYAVVAPIRPGYGPTGGSDTEISGVRYATDGTCTSQPDHSITANAALRSTTLALQWLREQPWAKADNILLQGQSVGGLTTVALCATNPPGVVGCINFAGGAGGSPERAPGRMCAPEKMTALMQQYGSTTKRPNIWFYAPNDQYWGEQPPKDWHAAYATGGSESQWVGTQAVPPDGHRLLNLGGKLWSEPLDAWLKKNGF